MEKMEYVFLKGSFTYALKITLTNTLDFDLIFTHKTQYSLKNISNPFFSVQWRIESFHFCKLVIIIIMKGSISSLQDAKLIFVNLEYLFLRFS